MAGVATKKDPAKWERAKARAKAKMGGKHSARAMQLATKYYKDSGGGYTGTKQPNNKLSTWSKEKWRLGTAAGKQFVKQPKSIAKKTAKFRSQPAKRKKV